MTDREKVIELCFQYLPCKKEDIIIHKNRLAGRSNRLFLVEIKDKHYTVRIPGNKGELFVDRDNEQKVLKVVEDSKLTSKTHFFDIKSGVKITEYIDGKVLSQLEMSSYIEGVSKTLISLHQVKTEIDVYQPLDEIDRLHSLVALEENNHYNELLDFAKKEYHSFNHEKKLIHGDFNPDNIVVTKDKKIQFLDFEYSTIFDPLYDIASFMSYSEELSFQLLSIYPLNIDYNMAVNKVLYYRILQCLKWYNVARVKHFYNLGITLTIDFDAISKAMLIQANRLLIKYKELT